MGLLSFQKVHKKEPGASSNKGEKNGTPGKKKKKKVQTVDHLHTKGLGAEKCE